MFENKKGENLLLVLWTKNQTLYSNGILGGFLSHSIIKSSLMMQPKPSFNEILLSLFVIRIFSRRDRRDYFLQVCQLGSTKLIFKKSWLWFEWFSKWWKITPKNIEFEFSRQKWAKIGKWSLIAPFPIVWHESFLSTLE